jgi:hypothetical protein
LRNVSIDISALAAAEGPGLTPEATAAFGLKYGVPSELLRVVAVNAFSCKANGGWKQSCPPSRSRQVRPRACEDYRDSTSESRFG